LCLGDREVPLSVSRHARARRLTLRLDHASGSFHLTLPRRAPLAEGLDFARVNAAWIRAQLEALPAPVPFVDGAVVPYRGEDHVIRHVPWARRGVWREDRAIHVSGFAEHLPRRARDFLKREAERVIGGRAQAKAAAIGRGFERMQLRDPKSRWASCSTSGTLTFSWRLIMTPDYVLDYVVAHEIAHLKHMNHGKRFWTLVDKLTPDTARARAWLNDEGAQLHRYG